MYLAAIDLGTNSVRLLVAETQKDALVPVRRELITTKLGSGLITSGRLSVSGQEATMQAVKEYLKIARHYDAAKIVVFGTSALRQAADGHAFARRLTAEIGLPVDILSAKVEASLSYLGVTQSLSTVKNAVVFDLGGGSCELIYRESNELKTHSYNLGALYLTEKFIKHDPPSAAEIESLRKYICQHFGNHLGNKKCGQLVGVGGTVTALAAMELEMMNYDAEKLHGLILYKEVIQRQLAKMLQLTADERAKLPGLPPDRALIMPAGALVVAELLATFGVAQFLVSQGDILLGSLYAAISSASI
ncbi:MAG: Ppx/GppA family phosphatase [Firmicutes bacterium]|nr:Ppx/GppA family phosphatase [Bacillota bacterium]